MTGVATRNDVVSKVLQSLLEGGLLLGCISGLPSPGRWGSRATSLAEQTMGIMLHGLLPDCIMKAFADQVGGGDDSGEDEEDFRAMLKRKV